jgi:pimeloyl-ACP methyl ester carboxylesterase
MFNVLPSSPLLSALEPFQAMCDYVAGHTHWRDLSLQGDGHPILIYPGLTLNGSSTADLRVRLQQLGYAVYDWRQGYNYGPGIDFDQWLSLLSKQLVDIQAHHQCSVSLIGCSLGGTYARELAKLHPHLVRQVITLATPFVKPDVIAAEKIFSKFTGTHFLIDDTLLQRLSEEPPVPCSSIYSQTDVIISGKAPRKRSTWLPQHRG